MRGGSRQCTTELGNAVPYKAFAEFDSGVQCFSGLGWIDKKEQAMVSTTSSIHNKNSTTPEQTKVTFDPESFHKKNQYIVHQAAPEFADDLLTLREMDRGSESKQRIFGGMMGLSVIPFFILIVILISGSSAIAATIFGIVGGLLLIGGIIGWLMVGHANLEDRRYEFLAQLVQLLSTDMPANGMLAAKMDLLPIQQSQKLDRKGTVGPWKVTYYSDRWLDLNGVLLDGAKFSVTMIQKHQDRQKTKRSRSGKLKTKHKTKGSSEAIVRIKLKSKYHPDTSQYASRLEQAIKLPPWTQLKSVTVQGHTVTLRTSTTVEWDVVGPSGAPPTHDAVQWVALMFLSLYQVLNENAKA